MLPNLSGLNLGCATGAQWGAGEEDYDSLMDEDGPRGLPDDQLGKISKALELLQRVAELPPTERFPSLEHMNARDVYMFYENGVGIHRGVEHDPGRRYGAPIEYPDAWRDFEDYMGFASYTKPKGLADYNGNPWRTNVAGRRARALRPWGLLETGEGMDMPPEAEGPEAAWGAWDPSEYALRDERVRTQYNINAFRFPNRQFSKQRRRELILQYVEAVVYESYRTQGLWSFFSPHGRSWSSIAQGIINWIVLGMKSVPRFQKAWNIADGPNAERFWNVHFANKDPYPFGSPILFVFMADVEKSPESYALAPEAIKQDPDVQIAYALLGVQDAAERAMMSIMAYAHLPEENMSAHRPLYRTILRRALKFFGKNSELGAPDVAYSKVLEELARAISVKADSATVRHMHQQLLEWLHQPDNPLGRQTLEDARRDFFEQQKRQLVDGEPSGGKRMRVRDTEAFRSMVAFHGKAAVLRWRIAEHVCVV